MTVHRYSWPERRDALLALAERNPELFTPPDVDAPAEMRGPCSSSGYCGCNCLPCLRGIHSSCGHRKGCHKNCPSR